MKRYIVREEYFGCLIYDKKNKNYLRKDRDFFETLEKAYNNDLNNDVEEDLCKDEYLVNGNINFDLIYNKNKRDNLLSAPKRIHLLSTSKCNMGCKHCYTQKLCVTKEMNYDERLNLLNQMEKNGIYEIYIGGGEPFVSPYFYEFLDECIKRKMSIKVFTNGLALSDDVIKKISGLDLAYLAISMDGINEDEYEKVRGVRKFGEVLKKIVKLKSVAKYPVDLSVTINNFNKHHPKEFLELSKISGVDRVKIRAIKANNNVEMKNPIYIDAREYKNFVIDLFKEYYKKYKNEFELVVYWEDFVLEYDEEKQSIDIENYKLDFIGGCYASKESMVIDSGGNASPCGFLPKELQNTKVDNINKKDLLDIWTTGENFEKLRKVFVTEECINCSYYGNCYGGCLARKMMENNSLVGTETWCLKKHFPERVR